MSNPSDVREIVKDNAQLYRESEEARQRSEDLNNFLKYHPQDKETEKILENLSE